MNELLLSTELIFRSKLTWILIFGPIALIGKAGLFGEATCFVLAGLTLIPLAERLSFVTEEVANHTNQTIGALLNATFGNAPELLISSAALKEGYYRVVQLTLLGSMLTNLLFVFGLSCLIGGLRYQVQELRVVTGNASIGMLMLAVAGLALPASLMLSDEMISTGSEEKQYVDKNGDGVSDINDGPTYSMVGFSRFNAVIMVMGYLLYLLFQLGSHSDEFEDGDPDEVGEVLSANGDVEADQDPPSRRRRVTRNKFCHRLFLGTRSNDTADTSTRGQYRQVHRLSAIQEVEMSAQSSESEKAFPRSSSSLPDNLRNERKNGEHRELRQTFSDETNRQKSGSRRRKLGLLENEEDATRAAPQSIDIDPSSSSLGRKSVSNKSHCSDGDEEDHGFAPEFYFPSDSGDGDVHMSFRSGLVWLFAITISISAMSDILVDTIDGFAFRYGISEVFTSLVILPYFSNIAEQVSAIIFAYRNKMDLCIGITVGSAVQIALFVLPGSVLIGWAMDRSMSLFFRGFETCCLIFSVVSVAAVLQGGTTNWLVGCYLMGVYFMVSAGFWFHELEDLTIDGELTKEIANFRARNSNNSL